ncbi:hypothetical protein O6H91_11G101500 [Diphasiastrum complanatum]|uniref:Uncharacterized protein n=1 Tax=Diphasiastrum complanatum TaxID=34168 RepID=A0ACC2CC67_DIPCM|nr:hypothetical protein O6H91_11G101500 [Diphasiastrum complanatum]
MLMAYGWPKFLPIATTPSLCSQPVVYLKIYNGLLLLITSTQIQVWSASQNKVRLGIHVREVASLQKYGENIQATSGHSLHFFEIAPSSKQLHFYGEESTPLSLVHVNELFIKEIPLQDSNSKITLCGDNLNIILGLPDGRLTMVSWVGEFLGEPSALQDICSALLPGSVGHISSGSLLRSPLGSNSYSHDYPQNVGYAQMELSAALHLLVLLLLDGRVLQCSIKQNALGQVQDIAASKWLGVYDAVCTSMAHEQKLLGIGTKRGTVELFNLVDGSSLLRTISLFDWGYSLEDTGPVSSISWTPDYAAFSVGWKYRGLAVWSVSGCRLMCTIRQGSASTQFSPTVPSSELFKNEPMANGVAALTWGEHAYNLFSVEHGHAIRLVQFSFVKSSITRCIAGSSHALQVLLGEDRLLVVESDEESQLKMHHLVIPQSYISVSWPVTQVAVNEDGTFLAIAGQKGLILYDVRLKKWRVFGDIMQERQICCCGLVWLGKIIIVCCYREATGMYELNLYPRYHLDESSLLYRKQLLDKPIALDVWQDYVLVAYPPFDIQVLHVNISGSLYPFATSSVQISTVRELSIMSARKNPIAIQLVPNFNFKNWGHLLTVENVGSEYWNKHSPDPLSRQPTRCMLLRTDGELSLLDLDQGSEGILVTGIERFWLTCGFAKEKGYFLEEVSWWAYGHQGMQVWYPSSWADTSQLDPEIDFDREVYPLGLSPFAGVIVGVSQRLSVSACAGMPCFEPTPQAQTILPCLLRHLLQRDKMEEAVQLARFSAGSLHFSHSLEWLLFTVFDAAISSQNFSKKRATGGVTKKSPTLLLQQVCDLIRQFPEYLDVVVSVARKTDGRHWPELFSAAGKSTELFEECFERTSYHTATCYILVIEKLEGPSVSQRSALRLLQATLDESMYELAGELVQFLLRIGREYEADDREKDRASHSPLASLFLRLPSTNFKRPPAVETDMLSSTVRKILEDHAIDLMSRKEIRELVAFVKETQFNLTKFLQIERDRSARLEDFPSALRTIGQKLEMDVLQSRLDAEFLLAHMCTVGFREWIVVLATLLRRSEVLLELFRGDMRLWQAYNRTLRSQKFFAEFEDLLLELESNLSSS